MKFNPQYGIIGLCKKQIKRLSKLDQYYSFDDKKQKDINEIARATPFSVIEVTQVYISCEYDKEETLRQLTFMLTRGRA
ncbi:hypothetical protein lbkm_0672 [Lachnospiraceae bacterium KM106-2]|nr:hypothetical protein lbkm_0672 [Lachnospiraceae bacterium KM106-2]